MGSLCKFGKALTIGNITKDSIIDKEGNKLSGCGGTLYASVAAKRLSYDSYLVTKNGSVSEHSHGDETISCIIDLKNEGIKCYWEPSKHTTSFVNDYSSGVRIQRLLDSTDVITYPPAARDSDFGEFDVILLNPLFHEITPETAKLARKDCSKDGLVALDVQGLVRKVEYPSKKVSIAFWEDREEYLRYVDVLKIGLQEIKGVSRFKRHKDICEELYSLGPSMKAIALTFGQDGSVVYDCENNELHKIPALKVRVVDETGAGDLYGMALTTRLYENKRKEALDVDKVLDAGIFATAEASFAVEGVGISKIPKREEVEERYEILKRELLK